MCGRLLYAFQKNYHVAGLFAGILLVVLTVVALIIFFVVIGYHHAEADKLASLIANVMNIALNTLGVGCVVYCTIQFRSRKFRRAEIHNVNLALDDGLLLLTMV